MVNGENNSDELLRELKEMVGNLSEDLRSQRNFEHLNSRIHTRESSTLIFSTVAVSASLLLLGILIGFESPSNIMTSLYLVLINFPFAFNITYIPFDVFQKSYDWLALVGVLIIILGILYREITIYSIDREDYRTIEVKCGVNLRALNKETRSTHRGIIVRLFFFTVLDSWWFYKGRQFLDFQYWMPEGVRIILLISVTIVIFIIPFLWRVHLRWKKGTLRELDRDEFLIISCYIVNEIGITINRNSSHEEKIDVIASYLRGKEIRKFIHLLKIELLSRLRRNNLLNEANRRIPFARNWSVSQIRECFAHLFSIEQIRNMVSE